MKYLGAIAVLWRDSETRELLSSSTEKAVVFNSKQKAEKWMEKVVTELGEKGAACDVFTYEIPSYVFTNIEEPPFEGNVTKIVIPYFYKKASKLFQKKQKVMW